MVLLLVPFAAGVVVAVLLWGKRAEPIFFSTAAEVIALGAVAMALQGGFFRVSGTGGKPGGSNYAMATILLSVGIGLGFAFGALARKDGGADPHMALTAGALTMGIGAFAVQAFFGGPSEQDGPGGVV